MRIILIAVFTFLALCFGFYVYGLKVELDALYAHFKNLRQQNCEFIAQFSANHRCNELIAYKFKNVLIQPPYFKANENYVFFYQLDAVEATQFEDWFVQHKHVEHINDHEFGLFSASWPNQRVHFLPQLTRNCLNAQQSCMGQFWKWHNNDYFQVHSYIVQGDDRKYWQAIQKYPFQCTENIAIDQQALKTNFPYIYQPKPLREYHYLFCWEAERRLLRISSVMTEAYLH